MSGPSMIPLAMIRADGRIRKAEPAQVARIAESIEEVGLLAPLTVTPEGDGVRLVAGLHRLEALRSLGREEAPCLVVDLDALRRVIAECDENLCRSLTAAERAVMTARRKEAYLALHPETAHGRRPTSNSKVAKFVNFKESNDLEKPAPRYTADQAAATGQDERAVQRDATRGERVAPEVLERVRGTFLDTGAALDRLARMSPEAQAAEVERLLASGKPARKVKAPPEPESEPKEEAPAASAEGDDFAAYRKGLRGLTREGLEDECAGLRAENAALRERLEAAEARMARMGDDLAAFEAEGDMGRKLGQALRQAETLRGSRDAAMQQAKRLEYILRTKGYDAKGAPLAGKGGR